MDPPPAPAQCGLCGAACSASSTPSSVNGGCIPPQIPPMPRHDAQAQLSPPCPSLPSLPKPTMWSSTNVPWSCRKTASHAARAATMLLPQACWAVLHWSRLPISVQAWGVPKALDWCPNPLVCKLQEKLQPIHGVSHPSKESPTAGIALALHPLMRSCVQWWTKSKTRSVLLKL